MFMQIKRSQRKIIKKMKFVNMNYNFLRKRILNNFCEKFKSKKKLIIIITIINIYNYFQRYFYLIQRWESYLTSDII